MNPDVSETSERLGNLSRSDVAVSQANNENFSSPPMTIAVGESSHEHLEEHFIQRCVIIQRDEKGYGFTVSGDNPVFVQSVKQDGAATRAGVQQGDRIVKVNGTLVTQFNHLEVVKLIRSGSYVALTLLGRPPGGQSRSPVPGASAPHSSSPTGGGVNMNTHHPLNVTPNASAASANPSSPSERVTAPQPVDAEKQQELTNRRIHTIKMMLEQELAYLEKLRSEFARSPSDKVRTELNGATKRVKTLQDQLFNLTGVQHDQGGATVAYSPKSPQLLRSVSTMDHKDYSHPHSPMHHHGNDGNTHGAGSRGNVLTHQVSAPTPLKTIDIPSPNTENAEGSVKMGHSRHNSDQFPPLSQSPEVKKWRQNSSHRHHRHISSPEGLSQFTEQLQAQNRDGIARTQSELVSRRDRGTEHEFDPPKLPDRPTRLPSLVNDERVTPPGTPPPPYACSNSTSHGIDIEVTESTDMTDSVGDDVILINSPCFIPEEPPPPPPRMSPCAIAANFEGRPLPPIPSQQMSAALAAGVTSITQSAPDCVPPALPPRPLPGQICNIISMEDEDFPSDSEVNQLDDHGPFMSLWKLLRNPSHLAVFLYYLISSRNPSSLFFYIISEIYKEGKLNEMKKWAYEIHSTFLVPEAPLRVNNVDETILYEIDDNLQNNLEKEDELRNIFTNARKKASEELNELLAEFRNKRTLGLGGFYGPSDHILQEANHDKAKEMKIIEQNLLPMLQGLCEDFENTDEKSQVMASALATVMKHLGVKSQNVFNIIDRLPTFVAKGKSRIRFLNRNKKMLFIKEHHFTPQHYCIVTYCNHCQLIIWGIGNQGYQCQNCEMNIHKNCVKIFDEVCLGRIRQKKDKKRDRMSGIMENIIGKNRKPSSSMPLANDRSRRGTDDLDSEGVNEYGEKVPLGSTAVTNKLLKIKQDGDANPVPGSIAELQNSISRKASSGAIGRSESFRQRREQRPSFRKRSDPNIPRSKSDVDVDDKAIVLNSSQSSSNSSLSTSLDSPSNSLEAVHRNTVGPMTAASKVDEIASSLPIGSGSAQTPHNSSSVNSPHNIHLQHHVYDDSDLEAETEAPNWQEGIEWEVVRTMKPKEKNRQDVINELFHTEKTHVRNLKVLESVFYRPMLQEQIASSELISLLFGNLDEMIEVHSAINAAMKEKKQENPIVGDIGDFMLSLFDGTSGENMKRAVATFCQNQSIALDMLKHRQRKDQKLAQFISEAEMNHLCRRLQLKDIIPTGMQRLTKYPLLLENIAKYTTGTEEHQKVLKAVDCSKIILNHVNQSVKEAENRQRMINLQKKLEKSHFDKVDHPISHEFRALDLAKYKLIHDGSLTWRLNKKSIDIHLLVLEQFLVLLQRQDDKYVLKFHNTIIISGRDETKILQSPIIKLGNAFIRSIATEQKGFFIVSSSREENQHGMYELVARTASERKMWVTHIQKSIEASQNRSIMSNPAPTLSERSESTDEPVETEPEIKAKEVVEQSSLSPSTGDTGSISDNGENTDPGDVSDRDVTLQNDEDCTPSTPPSGANGTKCEDAGAQSSSSGKNVPPSHHAAQIPPTPPASNSGTPSPARRMQRVEILQIAEGPRLIEPSEVVVTQGAVLQTAQPVLTPFEKLRRKDEQIVAALRDKQQIVADILNVPPGEFENIADVVTEVEGEKEPRELVLAAIVQVNKLASILNEALRVTEEDTVSASAIAVDEFGAGTSSVAMASSSSLHHPPRSPKSPRLTSKISRMPSAPTHKLLGVSRILNQQLTELLHVIVERDEEREQFRKELRSSREQIHLLHEATRRRRGNSTASNSRPNSFNSADTSSLSGDNCADANVLSDHCGCDIPQSDEESGANISPIQGVIPVIGLAESVQADDKSDVVTGAEPMNTTTTTTTTSVDHEDVSKEMFVDAPSDLPPVTITDLDCDHEVEINVDDPECDEGMVVDAIDDNSQQNGQMSADDEQSDKSDNNNLAAQQNSMIGAIFF